MKFSLFVIASTAIALSLASPVQSSPAERKQVTETCSTNTVSSFNIQARFKDDSTTTTTTVGILAVNAVPHVGFSILSAGGSSPYTYDTLNTGGLRGVITGNPYLQAVSYSLLPGQSPVFISTQYPPSAWSGYCFFPNLASSTGPNNLGANGQSDKWYICPNVTASGRLDVVYAAAAGHASYNVSDCRGVWLEQV